MANIFQKLRSLFSKQTYTVGSIAKVFARQAGSPWKQNLVLEFKDGTIIELCIEINDSNDVRLV
jgi:hypothetical protein